MISETATDRSKNIAEVWKEYKQTGSKELRDSLILYYAPLVKYVAGRIAATLPRSVDVQDLVSNGLIGLIDAIERFDISREIKFETYAIARIRGAIIDSLRALDWLPRSLRYRAKEIDRVYAELEMKLKRSPTEEELAEALGMSVDDLRQTLTELSYCSVVALEDSLTSGHDKEDSFHVIDSIEDRASLNPAELFEDAELKEIVVEAIKSLPEREKRVIILYYYENLTLKEIGAILGVSESRVSQIHSKAILKLQSRVRQSLSA
jgi:RNA polymerase sigma factor for flagellar operon FliA